MFEDVFSGKTVFITGHTGFKGSWLSEWMLMLRAKVVGFSLTPDPKSDPCHTHPSHFTELGLRERIMVHMENDVRNGDAVKEAIRDHSPDFIFHLAAQPLVRHAYDEPQLTMETNVLGTLNLLEAVRLAKKPCILLVITTDKVYENVEWLHSYREPDPLGGRDPYSASKACAEHIVSSYWHSFFAPKKDPERNLFPSVLLASARGGNVIGGGDWAKDRIVPDSMRALAQGEQVPIRNRHATRPWQHVLELLSGYMHLAGLLYRRRESLTKPFADADEAASHKNKLLDICSPFNFGPQITSNRSVGALVEEIFQHWPGESLDQTDDAAPKEAGKLNLTIDKAYHQLGWQPKWEFEESIRQTVAWYRQFYEAAKGEPEAVRALTQDQIREYASGLSYRVLR